MSKVKKIAHKTKSSSSSDSFSSLCTDIQNVIANTLTGTVHSDNAFATKSQN
jgi:hypothetical protein